MSSTVCIGRIFKSRGVKGEVLVLPLTSSPKRFEDISRVYIKLDEEVKEFTIDYFRPYGRTVILKFHGIDSPEDAKRLHGRELMIPEAESPPPPEGVYYYYQILGLQGYTTEGRFIGSVTDIIETGSNDVYVVRNGEREYLIPAIRDIVKEIDIKNRRMIVSPAAEGF